MNTRVLMIAALIASATVATSAAGPVKGRTSAEFRTAAEGRGTADRKSDSRAREVRSAGAESRPVWSEQNKRLADTFNENAARARASTAVAAAGGSGRRGGGAGAAGGDGGNRRGGGEDNKREDKKEDGKKGKGDPPPTPRPRPPTFKY